MDAEKDTWAADDPVRRRYDFMHYKDKWLVGERNSKGELHLKVQGKGGTLPKKLGGTFTSWERMEQHLKSYFDRNSKFGKDYDKGKSQNASDTSD